MTEAPPTLNRLRFMREASAIERCHKRPHLQRYSVGHHTHDALTLLILCWKEAHEGQLPRAELMAAMHIHDHAERVTGDIDGCLKETLGTMIDHVEEHVERFLDLRYELTEEEVQYLIAADKFEIVLWAYEETARGNATFMDWVDSYKRGWWIKPLPWPFMQLLDEVLAGRLTLMTNAEMLTAGGLS